MLDRIKEKFGAPAAIIGTGGMATAAVPDEFGWVVKASLMLFAAMFSFVVYFLKREHESIHAGIKKNGADVAETRQQLQQLQLSLAVQMREAQGQSNARVYGRINAEADRVTVIETKLGMRDRVQQIPHEDDPDKTPPMGVRTR